MLYHDKVCCPLPPDQSKILYKEYNYYLINCKTKGNWVLAEGDTCDLQHLVWMLFAQQGQIPEFCAPLLPHSSNVLIN